MKRTKYSIRQPYGYEPSDDSINSIALNIPKAALDGGTIVSLIALAYAVWCRQESIKFDANDDVGLKCLLRVKNKKSTKFGFRKTKKVERCDAPIINTSVKKMEGPYSKVTCICSKKHVTEIEVNDQLTPEN